MDHNKENSKPFLPSISLSYLASDGSDEPFLFVSEDFLFTLGAWFVLFFHLGVLRLVEKGVAWHTVTCSGEVPS